MNAPAPVRLPAEWETQEAVHIAWPANAPDWPGKFAPIQWVITEIIRHILPVARVRLLAKYDRHVMEAGRCLKRTGLDSERVEIIEFPIDRGWMRDISPAFVAAPDGRGRAVDFRFTGWAKYDNHKLDAKWPPRCARHLGLPLEKAEWRGRQVVLEGGAIDGNGAGTLLTTEECLLDPHTQIRNPGFTREDYEGLFAQYLGIERVVWLGRGIAGDDTHGHVDDLCRFVNKDTVLLCREKNAGDANHAPLEENRERLQGERLNVIELPMPAPVVFDGMRLPASYANFLITNGRVIVPTFNDPNDRTALGIIAEAFSGHVVVGVHAVDLVWGLGTVHCLTHEEPEFNR